MFLDTDQLRSEIADRCAGDSVSIAVPYITQNGMEVILDAGPSSMRVLTQIRPSDVVGGYMDLDALRAALSAGATLKLLGDDHRLHAKVFLFGDSAVVGSANLTKAGLERNVEAGVLLQAEEAKPAHRWFKGCWDEGIQHDMAGLDAIEKRLDKTASKRSHPETHAMVAGPVARLLESPLRQRRWFICNSNRKERSLAGSWESFMLNGQVASAWEPFSGKSTMDAVRPGDGVLLYGNGEGVIAMGIADDTRRVVHPGSNEMWPEQAEAPRWDIPVRWVPLRPAVRWLGATPG